MVISDLKMFIVFVALGLPFPQVHLSVGGGQQASSLSSKHKLWNFHRYSLVYFIIFSYHNIQITLRQQQRLNAGPQCLDQKSQCYLTISEAVLVLVACRTIAHS